jgi:hypothetical protein
VTKDIEEVIILGRDHWEMGSTLILEGKENRLASSFTWKSQDELVLTIRAVETPFCITEELLFEGDAVTIKERFNVPFSLKYVSLTRGKVIE